MRHDALRDSQPQSLGLLLPEYQFVFQPAMSYPEQVFIRVEEGLAVYSKFPIETHDYILLPRDRNDRDDVHQRIVLRVVVRTPYGPLQVLVSHFALTEQARDRAAVATWQYMTKFDPPQVTRKKRKEEKMKDKEPKKKRAKKCQLC